MNDEMIREIKKRNVRMMWFVLFLLGVNAGALLIALFFDIQKLYNIGSGGVLSLVLIALWIMRTTPLYNFQLKGGGRDEL